MKTTIFLLMCAAGLSAQSLAVTSPANGSVVTWGFSLTAAPASLPSLTQVRFYVDGRLECIANALYLGSWSCTQGMRYPTYSDERAATIYAEAYNAVGTKIATSATNTFRINNVGLNAVTTFNFNGGPVTKGATISGTGSFTPGYNVSSVTGGGITLNYNVDGVQSEAALPMDAPNSSVNLTTGSFTVPMITLPNGAPVQMGCPTRAGTSCTGGSGDMPGGVPFLQLRYLKVLGPNSIGFSLTPGGSTIVPTNQGVTTEYTAFTSYYGQPWVLAGNKTLNQTQTIDTTYFLDTVHRIETFLTGTVNTRTATATFTYPSAANLTTGIVTLTNFPLTRGGAVTTACSGTCPPQLTGTMYAVVVDANDFCFASSAANAATGICIGSLTSESSETVTMSFTVPTGFYLPGASGNYGMSVDEFTFANGAVPSVLRTKYSKIVGIAGDTFTLAPYYLNCDQSITSLSASHPFYSISDSAVATVSSTGVVTLGSKVGHAYITVADNLSSSTGRVAQPIDVEVRADRTTFKHLSGGHGVLSNYTPGQSLPVIAPFNGTLGTVITNPFPWMYLKPVFTAMIGGTNVYGFNAAGSGATNYAQFAGSGWWGGTGSYSKLAAIDGFTRANALPGGTMYFYTNGLTAPIIASYPAYKMTTDVWRQQALSLIQNDLYPYIVASEPCDECTSKLGPSFNPVGQMGVADDGLGDSTLGGVATGLQSIVVSGSSCSTNPCTPGSTSGTATIDMRQFWLTGALRYIQISGASSTKQLNGPHCDLTNFVQGFDDPRGAYTISFQLTVYDVANGTYNVSTDPNLVMTQNQEAYFEGCTQFFGYVSTTGSDTQGSTPTWGSPGPIGGPSSFVVSSNVGTLTWNTTSPYTDGQTVQFYNFSSTGLTGINYYRYDAVNSTSGTVRVVGVANGTYNSGTDPTGRIDGVANIPPSFAANMIKGYMTGLNPPQGATVIGGCAGGANCASWNGSHGSTYTDFIAQNVSPSGPFDRYGSTARAYRDVFRPTIYVDGSLAINDVPDDKPQLYETQSSGQTCDKFVATSDCRTDQSPGDLISFEPEFSGGIFVSNISCWILTNPAGCKPYQYPGAIGATRAPSPANPSGYQNAQAAPNEVDLYPDQWLAMVSAHLPIRHEDKYLLQPLLSSPDENTGPGPYPQIECQSHAGSYGNAMLCVNLSEEQQTIVFDTSLINLGGPMRRWNLGAFGDTVASLPPSTTSDTVNLLYGQAVLYISQASAAADDLKTINVPLTLPYGATNAALEIHYYPRDQVFQSVNCGTGACPSIPVNLHNLDIYVRKRFTKSDGTPVVAGDLERLAAQ